MAIHFRREVDKLRRTIFSLGSLVEENLQKAIHSMQEYDGALALEVVESDKKIDQIEIDVEEEGLKILALYQPVAGDLRSLISMLKINNDLERIGDLARDIAKKVISLCDQPPIHLAFDWGNMSQKTKEAFRKSMDALVNLNVDEAYTVGRLEDELDEMHKQACSTIIEQLHESNQNIDGLMALWSIAHYLENIADHAKKIAEDTIYIANGVIVRHQEFWKSSNSKSSSSND